MTTSALRVARALRPYVDPPASFQILCGASASRWLMSLGLGTRVGNQLRLTGAEARQARILVLRELEADDFSVLDAAPATRSETLTTSRNEKLLGASPRSKRIAVKAFPRRPLLMDGREMWLDEGDNLEVSLETIQRFRAHSMVVAVENWESFERLPALDSTICSRLPAGSSPIAIWRGSVEHPVRAALDSLELLSLPCYAYVDFDPAGLTIAASLPGFVDMLALPSAQMAALFARHGRAKLFIDQTMPRTMAPQEAINWRAIFRLCNQFAAGLPQEHF